MVATSIDVPGYGRLSIAPDANAPLLVVFGGIDVGSVPSGQYMWNYMNALQERFHIFVAQSNIVNGPHAYHALLKTVEEKGLTPSGQILYLFSGGYGPGMGVLAGRGVTQFSAIYLVDIWMGVTKKAGSWVPDFYRTLADHNAAKMTYVYTTFGANNEKARDHIAKKLSPRSTLVTGKGMDVHMSTNSVAVRMLL